MSHDPRPSLADERCAIAALLERAYRLALWLHDAERVDRPPRDLPGGQRDHGHRSDGTALLGPVEEPDASQAAFAVHVASSELLDVLDEARARLVAGAATARLGNPSGPPVRPSLPPSR